MNKKETELQVVWIDDQKRVNEKKGANSKVAERSLRLEPWRKQRNDTCAVCETLCEVRESVVFQFVRRDAHVLKQ